jgi:hypothetical protein
MMMLVALVAFVAMWIAVVGLGIWVLLQLLARFAKPAGPMAPLNSFLDERDVLPVAEAAEPVATKVEMRWAGDWPVIGAALAVVSGAAFLLGASGPLVIIGGAVAALIAVISVLGMAGLSDGTRRALLATAALGAAVFAIVGINAAMAAPEALRARDNVKVVGTATSTGDVWTKVICVDGTQKEDVDPSPILTYNSDLVTKVNSCKVSDDGDELPVYFFETADPAALQEWLLSGDLHVDDDHESGTKVFNDGSVAIVAVDHGSGYLVSTFGYEDIVID